MSETYRILDEPTPGAWQHLAVNPIFPLLAVMLAGPWLAWPWFVVNAIAVGSPTRTREIALAGFGFVGTAILALILLALVEREVITSELIIRLAALGIVVWKLGISYALCLIQSRTFHLFEYFEGRTRSGWGVLIAGYLLAPWVYGLFDSALWRIIISITDFGGGQP